MRLVVRRAPLYSPSFTRSLFDFSSTSDIQTIAEAERIKAQAEKQRAEREAKILRDKEAERQEIERRQALEEARRREEESKRQKEEELRKAELERLQRELAEERDKRLVPVLGVDRGIWTKLIHIIPSRQRELEAFRKAQEERERRIKERRLQFASAVKMQTWVRAFFARRNMEAVRAEKQERANEAAIQVQTSWRGASARATLRRLRTAAHLKKQQESAVLIQAQVRSALARQQRQRLARVKDERAREASATILQTQWRARQAREVYHARRLGVLQKHAAMKIQCSVRSLLARRLARDLAAQRQQMREQQSEAAVVLQCAWRAHDARKSRFLLENQHRARICTASTRIQACWRGLRARKFRKDAFDAIALVQSFVRMSLAKSAYVSTRESVLPALTALQARWRGASCRHRAVLANRERRETDLHCLELDEEEEYDSDGSDGAAKMQNRPVGASATTSSKRADMAYPEGYLAWRDDDEDYQTQSQSQDHEGVDRVYRESISAHEQDLATGSKDIMLGREETKVRAHKEMAEVDGKVAARVQAMWRGSRLRQRLDDALSTAKYVDEDDFDYSGVNMQDFLNDLGLNEAKLREYEDGDFGRPLDFSLPDVVNVAVPEQGQGWVEDRQQAQVSTEAITPPEQPAKYDYAEGTAARAMGTAETTGIASMQPGKYDYRAFEQEAQGGTSGPTLSGSGQEEAEEKDEQAWPATGRSEASTDAPSTSRRASKKEVEIDNVCKDWGFSKETAALMYKRKQRMLGTKKKRRKRKQSSAASRYRDFAKANAAAPPRRRGRFNG